MQYFPFRAFRTKVIQIVGEAIIMIIIIRDPKRVEQNVLKMGFSEISTSFVGEGLALEFRIES